VRFTAGLKEKRVIEELLTITIDSYTGKTIQNTVFKPAQTTRNLLQSELAESIRNAVSYNRLDQIIREKIQKRRLKLIDERQELYKKILVESKNTDQPAWLDDIIHIEEAGYDLLTITIIQPLN
jgi:hypothetical protein